MNIDDLMKSRSIFKQTYALALVCIALLNAGAQTPGSDIFIQAQDFTESSGVVTLANGEGNQKVSQINDGDWLRFANVDFSAGVRQFRARTNNIAEGGWIELRLGSVNGQLLGRCLVVAVDIFSSWELKFTEMESIQGVHDIFLAFRADSPDSGQLFELDWISFSDEPVFMTGNPIIQHIRTADPSVRVWDHHDGDKIWMYASHDMPDATDYSSMDGYHVFSTNDLKNWTDHGEVLHSRDVPWGHKEGGFMWAPDAHYKDGKYYFYFPHKEDSDQPASQSPWRTGVAVSDHPSGPFIPEPNYIQGTQGTDPAVFIDDDGQAYIFFGSFRFARLKQNMKELDHSLPGVNNNGHREVYLRNAPPVTKFMEGAWMHKQGDRYYYSWKQREDDPVTGITYDAHYAVSDRPDGVFEYMGPLNRIPRRAQNHHSIVEINDQWYFFFHVGGPGPNPSNRRMTCVAYLNHMPDGSMDLIQMAPEGVQILSNKPKFTITTTQPTNGAIILDPPGGSYISGRKVTLTAVGDLGYTLQSWGGDLSGNQNPTSIIMDGDKTISATFKEGVVVKLTTESDNGTIVPDPSGGNYNLGSSVTLTAVPDSLYLFQSWGGDLSGTTNPLILIMDSDKTVTAEFAGKPVSSVRIGNIPNKILVTGEHHQLSAIVIPDDAADKSVVWSSSNNDVATVDENGMVTAISQGSVTITVTTNDGGFSNTANMGIMSSGIAVTGVNLSACPSTQLKIDSTYQLSASVTPHNAGDLRVNWSSSDENVATVDASGLIRTLSAGEAIITVSTNDGAFTQTCLITVDGIGSTTYSESLASGENRSNVKVYPHPFEDKLWIENKNNEPFSIYNITGQKVFDSIVNEGEYQIFINTSSWQKGIYMVKVASKYATMIIKQ